MAILYQLVGSLLLLAIVSTGLVLIVAPRLGWRVLSKTGAMAALFFLLLFVLNRLYELSRAMNPLVLILILTALSAVAYFVREHRLGRPERREGIHHAERSPIMPQHAAEEAEE